MSEERDFLAEALEIIGGTSMYLATREHLLALNNYYIDYLKGIGYKTSIREEKVATESTGS